MKKISGSVFFLKKVYPVFVLFLIAILISVYIQLEDKTLGFVFSAFFGLVGLFLFYVYKEFIFDLSDEVYDDGNTLLFRKGGKEQRVKFKEIISINYQRYRLLERIILKTKLPGPIGTELVFKTPYRISIYSRTPMMDELIERIKNAKDNEHM